MQIEKSYFFLFRLRILDTENTSDHFKKGVFCLSFGQLKLISEFSDIQYSKSHLRTTQTLFIYNPLHYLLYLLSQNGIFPQVIKCVKRENRVVIPGLSIFHK